MSDLRAAVTAEALEWIGTPFRHMGRIKGACVDCAMLLAEVFERAGALPHVEIAPYSPQWHLHRDSERFIGIVLQLGREIEGPPLPGDIVVYKVGRCYAHGGIVIDWPGQIVHAYFKAGCVLLSGADDGELADRPRRFFSVIAP